MDETPNEKNRPVNNANEVTTATNKTNEFQKHYEPVGGLKDQRAYQPAQPVPSTQPARISSIPNLHNPSNEYEPVNKIRDNYLKN